MSFADRPPLTRPPVICAFKGWNDGGQAASVAAHYLTKRWGGRVIARIDPEEFYDFQVTRPTVRLEGGVSRVIEWPEGEFSACSAAGRDVVILSATEPNTRWRTYASAIVQAAKDIGSDLLVTFGAFLTDVPHTRPVPVVGSAQTQEVAVRLSLAQSQYEGPTGIVGVLHDASNHSGLPSVSLWAAVPHYLPAAPNPKAALALVRRACDLLEVSVDTSALEEATRKWEEGVANLIADNEELTEYVEGLESGADARMDQMRMGNEPVPTGDAIAAEVERFLREHGAGPTGQA